MVKKIDWKDSWTLEEYVIHLFQTKATDTSEFKTLLQLFGRERIEAMWRKYKAPKEPGSDDE